ncbi:ATP synthase F1 subunit gamma [Mycoplasma sp. 1018B]|uniref:ATP synthase F1 subunit gamma n=1 Tax=Mycoplasma sp. 1018B TaxID=2967302 RepID=UPI00211C1A89|nr:ATP synthase F1 subunit gamma [Mycoplasma sp. 1018B]UUM19101.1 ATP synthase F1 subunit gamma [Mycoplasma sp. 1018B]
MAGLQGLKNRIDAVQSIRKITHAMELVATSKLRKARSEYESVNTYVNAVNNSFYSVLAHLNDLDLKDLFAINQTNGKLYIICTGDIGLSGSFNSSVIKLAKKIITEKDKLILIGVKGAKALQKEFAKQIIKIYNSDTQADHYRLMSYVLKSAMEIYQNGQVNSINVIYSQYINNILQEETTKQIFPFNFKEIKQEYSQNSSNNTIKTWIEFDPSVKEVFNEAIPLYVVAQIYLAYASSKLSELVARRAAMESATDNADNLIADLQIKYNSKRQNNITQELNEIISGANVI